MADDLDALRAQIAAVDRELLDALNRRLALVTRVRAHKQQRGAPIIDAKREAELVQELQQTNGGPLSDGAVQAIFAAVLDVMKQESRGAAPPTAPAQAGALPVSSVAVVGTGLVGASVALAARRAGATVTGWDADAASMRAAPVSPAGSLADAVAGAELVVVAVPVGSLVDTVRAVLEAAGSETVVTDVGSTKRALASAIDDPRFVPGHPLAGGATGGPAGATADLFDGAVWFLTPTASGPQVELVERFVAALGAHAVRIDADAHDRALAI